MHRDGPKRVMRTHRVIGARAPADQRGDEVRRDLARQQQVLHLDGLARLVAERTVQQGGKNPSARFAVAQGDSTVR